MHQLKKRFWKRSGATMHRMLGSDSRDRQEVDAHEVLLDFRRTVMHRCTATRRDDGANGAEECAGEHG